jgi:thioredoxin-like negative regulator of GroEL
MLAPVLEKIAQEFKDHIVLYKANIEENQFQAQKFGIDRIPAVILLKDKKPINGFVGFMSEESIKNWLSNIIKK